MSRKASSLLFTVFLVLGTAVALKFQSSQPTTNSTLTTTIAPEPLRAAEPPPTASVTSAKSASANASRARQTKRDKPLPTATPDRVARRAAVAAPLPPPTSDSLRALISAAKEKDEEREGKRYDQPDEAAEFYRFKRAPKNATGIPTERYAVARERMKQMRVYSSEANRFVNRHEAQPEALLGGAWTNLGPGNIGGRTRALLINPANPSMVYAAGVAGGIWRSTDGGANWTALGDLMANMAVSTLVMEPNNPSVMYAGTGEGFFNGDSVRGAGIFKTTNGGITWEQLPATNSEDFYYVNKLVISKNDSKRLYAATRTGVWRSLDSGATWTQVLETLNDDGDPLTGGCLDLVIRTDKATDYVFASCGTFEQATIYRNTDAAGVGTWDAVHTEENMGRTSLALAPSNQDIIYAAAVSNVSGQFDQGLHAVFRSTASGAPGSWTAQVRNTSVNKLNTVLFTNPLFAFYRDCRFSPASGNAFFNQGWYDNVLAVDPLDPNRVWVGGIDLFRSDDGGQNWGLASYWANNGRALPFAPSHAHADQHAIVFHPNYNGTTNQTMFVGGDGGIFRTDNARANVAIGATAPCNPLNSQIVFTPLNNHYGVTQFYHGAVYPDGKTYFGGTQDNGTVRGSDSAGLNGWREINGGDGGYVAVNPQNTNTLFAETTGISLRKSTNGGFSFHAATSGITSDGLFITPFAMDPSDPERLWIGGEAMFRTTNAATNWQRASLYFFGGGFISAIAIAPTDANAVLVGNATGDLLGTSEALMATGRTTWDMVHPRDGFVSSVAIDPKNDDVAYATYSTFGDPHIWKTVDGGQTWLPMDGTGANKIPDIPVHTLVIDPSNTERLYVGTDLGVFASLDGGATWNVENTGFPNTVVETLAINVHNGVTTLYAFTHGRGAWKVDINNTGCNFTLNRTGQTIAQTGGTGSVDVTTAGNSCDWTASSNDDWLTVNSFNVGTGKVNFTAAANTTFWPRIGTLAVAGRSYTITQPGLRDTAAPTVQITKPTTQKTFSTNDTSLTLEAVIKDNDIIDSVQWVNDRGDDGIFIPGLDENVWVSNIINLRRGLNNFTVTATDRSGNRATAMIAVTRQPDVGDTQAPTVKITFPTENPTLITTAGLLSLEGTAADNTRITHLFWSNDRGGSGRAFGTTDWFADDIPLQVGVNKITVTAFDGNGNTASATLQVLLNLNALQTTRVIAGLLFQPGFNGDNQLARNAQLWTPDGLAFDAQGNLYVAEASNHRVRRIALNGTITTVAGTGRSGLDGDGGPATQASLHGPTFLAFDAAGNLYIADSRNHKVRKVTPGGIISTVAGNGRASYSGDGGPATEATLQQPTGLAFDAAGNLYIADTNNNRIRKVEASDGTISTFGGNGFPGFSGDGGPAINASFNFPIGLAFDRNGNLFMSDAGNARIRRIATDGRISTIAGTGVFGFSGDGGLATAARLTDVYQLTFGTDGSLYFADGSNQRIRRITPDNRISTVMGDRFGTSAEGVAPSAFAFAFPVGVAVDAAGNVFAADEGGHRIVAAVNMNGVATVEAAGFTGPTVARDATMSAFGQRLATTEAFAPATPAQLPTTLAGTTVTVRDSLGVERLALLLYVGPTQVNYIMPIDAAEGFATVTVRNSLGEMATGFVEIVGVMPGLFSANMDGTGAAAGWAVRVRNGVQTREPITMLDVATNKFAAKPIDFDPANEQLFVELYGTGIRYRSSLANVKCEIGGVSVPVEYAFVAPGFFGLDQVNIRLLASLDNRGEADLVLTVDGKKTRVLKINIR
jgi:uncharacterized protein (TIGR03437 family)